jgi:hypothetical protein
VIVPAWNDGAGSSSSGLKMSGSSQNRIEVPCSFDDPARARGATGWPPFSNAWKNLPPSRSIVWTGR